MGEVDGGIPLSPKELRTNDYLRLAPADKAISQVPRIWRIALWLDTVHEHPILTQTRKVAKSN
jgi:hypothetical protein